MGRNNIDANKIIESRKSEIESIGKGIAEGILKGTKEGVKKGLKEGAKAAVKEFTEGGMQSSTFEDIGTIVGDIGGVAADKLKEESINLAKRKLKAHIRDVVNGVIEEMRKRTQEVGREEEDYVLDMVVKSYQEAVRNINKSLPPNPVFREIVEQVTALVDECVDEEIEEQKADWTDTTGSIYSGSEKRISKDNNLVQDIRETMASLSESIVSEITCRIAKSVIKRVLGELKEKLLKKSEHAYHKLENRLKKIVDSDEKLCRKLDKSINRMTEEISGSQYEVGDYAQAIERTLTETSKSCLEPLSNLLTPFQICVTAGVAVAVASVGTAAAIPEVRTEVRTWLDSEPPNINVSYSLQADQRVMFTAQGNDNLGIELIEFYVNEEMVNSCEGSPCSYIGGPYPEGGIINYRVVAFDTAGNRAQSNTETINIADRTPPEITESSYLLLGENRVTFTGRGQDNVEMERIELYVNGILQNERPGEECTFSGGPYPEGGIINYRVVAFDTAGNRAQSSTKTINIADRTPPEITESSYLLLGDNRVTFTARGQDNVEMERIELYVNGILEYERPGEECTFTGGPYPEGETINYSFTAVDTDGNSKKTLVHELFIPYLAEISLLGSSGGLSLAAVDVTKMIIYTSFDGGSSWEYAPLPVSALMSGDVVDLAVAEDNSVIWAAPGSTKAGTIYKSTNGGSNWSLVNVIAGSATINADLVSIAQDNSNIVAVCEKYRRIIYVTTNGGDTWSNIGIPTNSVTITDMDISAFGQGDNYLFVTGTIAGGAEIWYYALGIGGPWTPIGSQGGGTAPQTLGHTTALAVKASPNFASDLTAMVVTTDGIDTFFNLYSRNDGFWNASAAFVNYPVIIETSGGGSVLATAASIAPAPTYLGGDEVERVVFVGITDAAAAGGVYRLEDTNDSHLTAVADIYSVAYDGATLVAGSTGTPGTGPATVYRCTNPLDSSPSFYSTAAAKSPGGATNTVVAWTETTIVAGTAGNESAFAVSKDNGASFNDVSLIDTSFSNIIDLAISFDGTDLFLLTHDGADTSLWRRTVEWERVLSIKGKENLLNMVKLPPDLSESVYLASTTGTTLYYSNNSGDTKWYSRSLSTTPIDLAVESGSVAYVLFNDGSVSKTTNSGFAWDPPRMTGLAGGASIISTATNRIAVGGNNGDIAWSNDGGITWKRQEVIPGGSAIRIAGGKFTDEGFLYAGGSTSNGIIVRWDTISEISPSTIISDIMNGSVNCLLMADGKLFALIDNAIDGKTRLYRLTSPSTASKDSKWDTIFQ